MLSRRTLSTRPCLCNAGAALVLGAHLLTAQAQAAQNSSVWEAEIKAFEAADQTNPPPRGAILFVGSSSIRLWKSMADDLSGYRVINRGFGGSQIEDSTALADRIIFPYNPRTVVLYAGDNDIAAGKSPEQVFDDFKAFVTRVRAALPQTKIAFISIKPSPSRRHLLDKQREANRLIEQYCKSGPGRDYIDVFNSMLGPDGQPLADLFAEDKLHLNLKGYKLWSSIIQPHLKSE